MITAGRFCRLSAIAVSLCMLAGCVPIAMLEPAEVVAGLSDLILHPDTTCEELRARFGLDLEIVNNPAEAGLSYEEVRIPIDETKTLRAWYMPTEGDLGTVIVSMGDAGNMACYLYTAKLLYSNGWSVVMYDYEGFGGSDGPPTLYALSRDLRAVIDWTRAATGRDQVTLMGMSLGSIPSIALAVQYPEAVNAVVLDSPIALRRQIFRFGFLVGGQSAPLVNRLSSDLLSDDLMSGLHQPLLIFAHGRDFISDPASVELLFERASGPKQLVMFPTLGHSSGQFYATGYYVQYLTDFLMRVWTGYDFAAAGE